MIKKSIIIAVVLLLAYEAFIRFMPVQWDTSQNDKSANIINAQNFIYNVSGKAIQNDTVIVGSSISRKLVTEMLGKNFVNLAFNAWSSYDGLQIIKRTGKKPACLLMEMNVVGNQTLQQDIVNSLSPLSYYPNTVFKSFQLQNQPVGLFVGAVKEQLKAKMEAMRMKKRENQELYNYNLKLEKDKLINVLPDTVLTARFTVLKTMVDELKKENIDVVFFEVPFDAELENTPTLLANRKYFQQYFPNTEYKYIALPPVNDYVYSDGIHLSVQSAPVFTNYLKTELQKLKNK